MARGGGNGKSLLALFSETEKSIAHGFVVGTAVVAMGTVVLAGCGSPEGPATIKDECANLDGIQMADDFRGPQPALVRRSDGTCAMLAYTGDELVEPVVMIDGQPRIIRTLPDGTVQYIKPGTDNVTDELAPMEGE